MAKKPNLVVVFADQMRGEALHCDGNRQLITPNFDRMAESGVFCSNAIANCPVCTPSRGSLLTGRHPLGHQAVVNDLPLPAEQVGIAEILRPLGYACGYVGKWHLDGIPRGKFTPPGPRRQGFDDYWAAYECHHNYFDTKYFLDTDKLVRADGYEPDVQTELAIRFMKERRDKPFCLFLSWGPPHAPYQLVPERFKRMYDPDKLELRPNCQKAQPRVIADYYAAVTALDECFGRITAALDELGLAEDTLLVFTADHGDMLWSQGRQKKQQPWEECIRIPFMMKWPGTLPAGVRRENLVGVTDMAPTFLSLLGVKPPEFMEGVDLSATLRDGTGPDQKSVPIMDVVPADQARNWGGREWRGVRTRRYTYARNCDAAWVLYDNEEDPFQLNNLVGNPDYESLENELEEELQGWLKRMGDKFLSADEHLAELGLTQMWRERQEHFHSGRNW